MHFVINDYGSICVVQYDIRPKKRLILFQENCYPHSSFPRPLMLIVTQYFQWSSNEWSLSILEGGGRGLRKMVITFHFLATLNFIYGPFIQNSVHVLLILEITPLKIIEYGSAI